MTDYYDTTEDKTLPVICYVLYLLAFTNGLTAVIGLVLAYSQRTTAGPVMASHYTFLIRTFWIGLLLAVVCGIAGGLVFGIGALLSVILIGFPIMGVAFLIWGVAAVWFALRCIVGLVWVSRGDAYPRPEAVLI